MGGTSVRGISRLIKDGKVIELKSTLSWLVEKGGWRKTKERLLKALEDIYGPDWFGLQQFVLQLFDMQELSGFDGDIQHLLESIDNFERYDEVRISLYEQVLLLIEKQIENNGSLLVFDTEKMLPTRSGVLVKQLLEMRQGESQNVILIEYDGLVDLRPLWLTHYGFEILKANNAWIFAERAELRSIRDDWKRIGAKLQVSKQPTDIQESTISNRMREHILSLAVYSSDPEGMQSNLLQLLNSNNSELLTVPEIQYVLARSIEELDWNDEIVEGIRSHPVLQDIELLNSAIEVMASKIADQIITMKSTEIQAMCDNDFLVSTVSVLDSLGRVLHSWSSRTFEDYEVVKIFQRMLAVIRERPSLAENERIRYVVSLLLGSGRIQGGLDKIVNQVLEIPGLISSIMIQKDMVKIFRRSMSSSMDGPIGWDVFTSIGKEPTFVQNESFQKVVEKAIQKGWIRSVFYTKFITIPKIRKAIAESLASFEGYNLANIIQVMRYHEELVNDDEIVKAVARCIEEHGDSYLLSSVSLSDTLAKDERILAAISKTTLTTEKPSDFLSRKQEITDDKLYVDSILSRVDDLTSELLATDSPLSVMSRFANVPKLLEHNKIQSAINKRSADVHEQILNLEHHLSLYIENLLQIYSVLEKKWIIDALIEAAINSGFPGAIIDAFISHPDLFKKKELTEVILNIIKSRENPYPVFNQSKLISSIASKKSFVKIVSQIANKASATQINIFLKRIDEYPFLAESERIVKEIVTILRSTKKVRETTDIIKDISRVDAFLYREEIQLAFIDNLKLNFNEREFWLLLDNELCRFEPVQKEIAKLVRSEKGTSRWFGPIRTKYLAGSKHIHRAAANFIQKLTQSEESLWSQIIWNLLQSAELMASSVIAKAIEKQWTKFPDEISKYIARADNLTVIDNTLNVKALAQNSAIKEAIRNRTMKITERIRSDTSTEPGILRDVRKSAYLSSSSDVQEAIADLVRKGTNWKHMSIKKQKKPWDVIMQVSLQTDWIQSSCIQDAIDEILPFIVRMLNDHKEQQIIISRLTYMPTILEREDVRKLLPQIIQNSERPVYLLSYIAERTKMLNNPKISDVLEQNIEKIAEGLTMIQISYWNPNMISKLLEYEVTRDVIIDALVRGRGLNTRQSARTREENYRSFRKLLTNIPELAEDPRIQKAYAEALSTSQDSLIVLKLIVDIPGFLDSLEIQNGIILAFKESISPISMIEVISEHSKLLSNSKIISEVKSKMERYVLPEQLVRVAIGIPKWIEDTQIQDSILKRIRTSKSPEKIIKVLESGLKSKSGPILSELLEKINR